jgi:hypothetical protein
MSQNEEILSDLIRKCGVQDNEISKLIGEILNGIHRSQNINKVEEKIRERLENFKETLYMLEDSLRNLPNDRKHIWKK